MSDNVKKVLLVGTGAMAEEYVKVMDGLGVEYIIAGNSKESVDRFNESMGQQAYCGGIEKFLDIYPAEKLPEYAIVAVNGKMLYETTRLLLQAGVSKILVEKPGVVLKAQIEELDHLSKEKNATVFIAYNRRFYCSVKKAKEFIEQDGGILSMNFEFTEWQHVIEKTDHPDEIKQKWFLMNSSHVVDLAFYLSGKPKEITTYKDGSLCWHNAGSRYVGCGVTEQNVLFNYQANWEAPGRWGIEILTRSHRLYLRPMEKLQVQNNGTIIVENCEIDDEIDVKYKAGLYNEVNAFLNPSEAIAPLCTLEEQKENIKLYEEISGEEY